MKTPIKQSLPIIATIVVVFGLLLLWAATGSDASVTLENVPAGTTVYVDEVERTTLQQTRTLTYDLDEGTHSILLAREDYWPWAKEVTITEDEESFTFSPFFVRQSTGRVLGNSPTPPAPEITLGTPDDVRRRTKAVYSDDELVSARTENGTIIATWQGDDENRPAAFCPDGNCKDTIEVYGTTNVNKVAFWPDRNDVLIFADQEGVYAIELDARGLQNFQPLYRSGTAPNFEIQNGVAIIFDGDVVRASPLSRSAARRTTDNLPDMDEEDTDTDTATTSTSTQ